MKNTPLWMPIGSVRSLLAIMIVLTGCIAVLRQIPIPTWFEVGFSIVVGLYFMTRRKQQGGNGEVINGKDVG